MLSISNRNPLTGACGVNDANRIAGILLAEIQQFKSSPSEETDALVGDLHSALNLITSRADAREVARRKNDEWQRIIPECRAAKDKFERVNGDYKRANDEILQLYKKVDDAESRVNLARDAKPTMYPTKAEIEKWEARCRTLEDAFETARANVREANARRGQLSQNLLQARNQFSALSWRERNLRPRETEPYRGSELTGVR